MLNANVRAHILDPHIVVAVDQGEILAENLVNSGDIVNTDSEVSENSKPKSLSFSPGDVLFWEFEDAAAADSGSLTDSD